MGGTSFLGKGQAFLDEGTGLLLGEGVGVSLVSEGKGVIVRLR